MKNQKATAPVTLLHTILSTVSTAKFHHSAAWTSCRLCRAVRNQSALIRHLHTHFKDYTERQTEPRKTSFIHANTHSSDIISMHAHTAVITGRWHAEEALKTGSLSLKSPDFYDNTLICFSDLLMIREGVDGWLAGACVSFLDVLQSKYQNPVTGTAIVILCDLLAVLGQRMLCTLSNIATEMQFCKEDTLTVRN